MYSLIFISSKRHLSRVLLETIIMHEEPQLRIGREKLKIDPDTSLHVDTTDGMFHKYCNEEVYYSVACFRGIIIYIFLFSY